MDANPILELLLRVPLWVWGLAAFIAYAILFGDRKNWEYEAKFPHVAELGRGEIELESYQKQGTKLEVDLHLEPSCLNKDLEVCLGQRVIYKLPARENQKRHLYQRIPLQIQKPNEGEKIVVKVDGVGQLEGVLIRD